MAIRKAISIFKKNKIGDWSVVSPVSSLNDKSYIMDGQGCLWTMPNGDYKKFKLIQQLMIIDEDLYLVNKNEIYDANKNFALLVKSIYPITGPVLVDADDNLFIGTKNGLLYNNKFYGDFEVMDLILGEENVYVLGKNGEFVIYDKSTMKEKIKDFIPGAKYILLGEDNLYVIGSSIICINVNDKLSGKWPTLYHDERNTNTSGL